MPHFEIFEQWKYFIRILYLDVTWKLIFFVQVFVIFESA